MLALADLTAYLAHEVIPGSHTLRVDARRSVQYRAEKVEAVKQGRPWHGALPRRQRRLPVFSSPITTDTLFFSRYLFCSHFHVWLAMLRWVNSDNLFRRKDLLFLWVTLSLFQISHRQGKPVNDIGYPSDNLVSQAVLLYQTILSPEGLRLGVWYY
jgi:hypothetical protein